MPYTVTIVETATGEVVKRLEAHSEREAERIARGASINLNHERFHIAVEPLQQGEPIGGDDC